jgi:glycosyltransferase involved in cell wall biosynthesis
VRIAVVAPLVTAITEPQLGGSQALLADIASGLVAREHEVTVFAATGSHIDGVNMIETGIDPSSLSATLFRAGDEQTSDPAREAFAHVYALVATGSFDIVHNHAFDVPAVDLAPADLPVVHTLHLPPSRAIASALSSARTRSRSLTVAAVSRFGAASWASLTDVDVVLQNGVPVDRIPFSSSAARHVLFAGRLSVEKGVAEAIDIAEGAGFPITVVGGAYDVAYASERIAPRRSEGVTIIDAVPRAELWRMMGASHAVLCPALWDEPFGLVAAEAQAAGTPVVAFSRGALGEVVRNNETGVLVDDVSEAAEALRSLDIERSACRLHAERNLSLDRTLDAHEALYARLAPAATTGTRRS